MKKKRILASLAGAHTRRKVLLATVSGVVTTNADMISYADRNLDSLAMITTKSYQVEPNPGNREPIITEPEPGCWGNSVGLRNPGMRQAREDLSGLTLKKLLNLSISGSSPEEFITLARYLVDTADLLELNFSCPHAADGYGSSIGGSWRIASSYMEQIRSELGDDFPLPIIPKLTPNTSDIRRIAESLLASGADGLAAINTVGPECYIEPHSGKPILQNSLGGRGGKSGHWVYRRAMEVIREVRRAVGEQPLLLGMGGVSTGAQAAEMILAGADTVGIGSSFGKVDQVHWGSYLERIREEAEALLGGSTGKGIFTRPSSRSYLSTDRSMEFTPYRMIGSETRGEDVKIITLKGRKTYQAGEFVFLWIPGVGEKPFSIALDDPLTFLFKRRGPFTEALWNCSPGDTIYMRGPYGKPVQVCREPGAVLIAGGTGIAVLPALARMLHTAGRDVQMFYGASDGSAPAVPLGDELTRFGPVELVFDEGTPGRVLDLALRELENRAVYLVGPEPFMDLAARRAAESGISGDSIYLSLEQPTFCGVGLCGACSCRGVLTCRQGTFVTWSQVTSEDQEEQHD